VYFKVLRLLLLLLLNFVYTLQHKTATVQLTRSIDTGQPRHLGLEQNDAGADCRLYRRCTEKKHRKNHDMDFINESAWGRQTFYEQLISPLVCCDLSSRFIIFKRTADCAH